jgi:hypothetical protein
MSGNGTDTTGSQHHLSSERSRVMSALGKDVLGGPAIFRRMSGSNTRDPGDQGLLYPALYSLTSSWRLRAYWQTDETGIQHRVYRRARFGFLG